MCWVLDRVLHTSYVIFCAIVKAPGSSLRMLANWTIVTSKNGGRKKFQIHFGLDMMNFARSKAWDGKSEQPNWMRQGSFVPCNCEECYFCLNGHTTSIQHRAKKQRVKMVDARTGNVVWTDECLEKRVDLKKGGSYCRQCIRKLEGATSIDGRLLTFVQKEKLCKTSRLGFPQPGCNEKICKRF